MSDLWGGTEECVPECLETEKQFLATLLQPGREEDLYEFSLVCPPSYFHKPQHRMVWEAGLKLAESGAEIAFSSLVSALGPNLHKVGGHQGLGDILMAEEVLYPKALLSEMRAKAEARESLISLGRAIESIRASGEVGTSLDSIRSLADTFSPQESPIRGYTDLFESMEAGNGALPIDKSNNLPIFGVHGLDQTVGAMAGTLGVVAAKTSAGKSSLAYQIAVSSAARGRRVLLISLEADREEVSSAMAANLNQANRGSLLRTGVDDISIPEVVKGNIQGYHAGSGVTWDQLEKAIRIEHRKNPFNVIILDYFTLLEPPNYKGNRNMASLYGEISKAGKRIAQQLECSVIFLSQFNRGVEDGQEPFLENLRETGQLEQDADWVVLLWAKPEDEPEGFRYVNAKVAKNRKGKRGEKFRMKLFPAEARFIASDTEIEVQKPRRRA